jgi:hypothetical protein
MVFINLLEVNISLMIQLRFITGQAENKRLRKGIRHLKTEIRKIIKKILEIDFLINIQNLGYNRVW